MHFTPPKSVLAFRLLVDVSSIVTRVLSLQVEDSSALTMLEEVNTVESRQDVAMTLVKIYLGQGLVVPFLDYLNTREVNNTSKIKGTTSELFKMFGY